MALTEKLLRLGSFWTLPVFVSAAGVEVFAEQARVLFQGQDFFGNSRGRVLVGRCLCGRDRWQALLLQICGWGLGFMHSCLLLETLGLTVLFCFPFAFFVLCSFFFFLFFFLFWQLDKVTDFTFELEDCVVHDLGEHEGRPHSFSVTDRKGVKVRRLMAGVFCFFRWAIV